MTFSFFDAAGTADQDGIFIPVTAVDGLSSAELAATQPETLKQSKTVYAILERIYSVLSPSTFRKLGITVSKASPNGVASDTINQNYGFTNQKLLDFKADAISIVPVPTGGANNGLGKFSITDVFAGAARDIVKCGV